eukprot:COSAG02_NODE_526_length_20707_cov_11.431337_5_plen_72_part_00
MLRYSTSAAARTRRIHGIRRVVVLTDAGVARSRSRNTAAAVRYGRGTIPARARAIHVLVGVSVCGFYFVIL